MSKSLVIEPYQVRHALKIAAVTGRARLRDVAVLAVLYSTGVMPNEAAKLIVSDYLTEDGRVRVDSTLRAEITVNGKVRPLVWASRKTCSALDDYLRYRLDNRHGVSTAQAAYRGLDPLSPLFLAEDGEPFTFTRRVTRTSAVSYSCESLTELIRRLHEQAGIEGGNASAARRSFAVGLHREGRSMKVIQQLTGLSSLAAVKKLVDSDPVTLASIVRGVI